MANIKFSAFTTETNSADVDFLVGYQGTTMKKIAPSNLGGSYPFLIDTASLYSGFVPTGLSGNPQANTVLGIDAGANLTTGSENVYIGYHAGKTGTTANRRIAIGTEANGNTSTGGGQYSVSIGWYAGYQSSANEAINIGRAAGQNCSGVEVINIGRDSGRSIIVGPGAATNLGYQCGYSQTSGTRNTNIGYQAAFSNTSNSNRTIIGYQAGQYTTGASNTFVGRYAGRGASGASAGERNTSLGDNALGSIRAGVRNVAVGNGAGQDVQAGDRNTMLGTFSGSNLTSGDYNIIIGNDAQASSSTVNGEITIGDTNVTSLRLPGLQSGASDGDVLTFSSGTGLITLQSGGGGGGASSLNGLSNCLVDTDSLYVGEVPASLSGNPQGNTVLGIDAGNALTSGNNNTFIGNDAAKSISSGFQSTVIGTRAYENGTGFANVAIGYRASSSGGNHVVIIGREAGLSNTADNSVIVGSMAARQGNSASAHISIGYQAGYSQTTGTQNTNLGYQASYSNTTSGSRTTVGYQAGRYNTQTNNTFIGAETGRGNANGYTGQQNTAVGARALTNATGGNYNTVIGYNAGEMMTNGEWNTLIGRNAAGSLTTGDQNVVIGMNANVSGSSAENQIVIGQGSTGLGDNTTLLGNSSTTTTVIKGNVGLLDATTPGSALDILSATNGTDSVQLRLRTTAVSANTLQKVVGFYQASTSERGYIAINQYSVQYNTSSDYRLKENIVEINDGISRLKSLKPCRFNFISPVDENGNKLDPNPKTLDGFIAHEAQAVIPECVGGDKDAVDKDGKPVYQGIDQSKIVPLLTAALKEAVTKIEQLETRIQTLENN